MHRDKKPNFYTYPASIYSGLFFTWNRNHELILIFTNNIESYPQINTGFHKYKIVILSSSVIAGCIE